MGADVFPIFFIGEVIPVKRDLITENARCCDKFGHLAVICEGGYDIWDIKGAAIFGGSDLVGALGEERKEGVEEWEHHLGWKICSIADAVVVAEILSVCIRSKFHVCED